MKLLIIDSTKVSYGDDRGAIHEDAGAIVDVTKEVAKKLTEANRALYVNPADDPFKDRRFTASKDMLQAAEAMAKAKAAKAKAAAKAPATGEGQAGQGDGQSGQGD
jgi:hypothetical protein